MIFDNSGKPPGSPGPGLHFLKALGHAALAWGEVAFAEERDDDEAEELSRRPRRRRIGSKAGGQSVRGSCCLGKRR
jgi:hypothetical protein